MKSEFLKIAGVKSEKAFYKKYPTEAAFFKAHPEAKKSIKKAQAGINIDSNRNGIPDYLENMNPNIGNIIQGQMKSPGVNAGMYTSTPYPTPDYNKMYMSMSTADEKLTSPIDYNKQYMSMSTADEQLKQPQGQQPSNANAMMQGGANIFGGIMSGVNKIREQKRLLDEELIPWDKALDVVKKARISNMFAEQPKRTWIRPDDQNQIFNINQMFPGQGVGTNILSAKNGVRLQNGGMVGGNPTEIQNTYDGDMDIYSDLEYEPLYDVNQVKSYEYGGEIPSAQWGVFSPGNQGFGENTYGSIPKTLFPNSGQSEIFSSIGSVAGPRGALIGGMLGGMFDRLPSKVAGVQRRINNDLKEIAGMDYTQGVHGYLNGIGVAENGANLNPQVIAKFGELDAQDYAKFAHKDEFRSGGHMKGSYIQPSERALSTYALGGQLKTTWGGEIETISDNPYDESETVLFRGASHDDGGIGVKYGEGPQMQDYAEYGTNIADVDVEVQGNEPAKILNGDLVVAGGMKTSKEAAQFAGNPKFVGKKYQTNIKELANKDAKIISKRDKLADELSQHDDDTRFGLLKKQGIEKMLEGLDGQLAINSDQSKKLLIYQNQITDEGDRLSEVYGKKVDPNFIEKGEVRFEKESGKAKNGKTMKLKEAMFGSSVPKAQGGYKTKGTGDKWSFTQAGETGNPLFDDMQRYENEWVPSVNKALSDKERAKRMLKYIETYSGEGSTNIKKALNKIPTEEGKIMFLQQQGTNKQVGPIHHVVDAAIKFTEPSMTTPLKDDKKVIPADKSSFETVPYKRNIGLDILGQVLPYLRKPYEEGINPSQFAPEINAMLKNKLEPVPMQKVTPYLDDVIDISYQDILNENDSDFLTALRGTDNPAMKASLLAQKYGANAKVKGEEFIANQLSRNAVFSGNRAKLFDAQVKNIAAAADQAYKQDVARSKTNQIELEAFKSMTDKQLKHDADVRKYNVYKTLFPQFGFERSGRGIFEGGYNQFNIPYVYGADGKVTHKIIKDNQGNIIGYQPIAKEEAAAIPPMATPPIVEQTANQTYAPVDYTPIDEEEYTNQEYMDQVAPKKLGGKVKKKYSQSSIVRAFK